MLRTHSIDIAKYKYFVIMNSSARGPFLPAYWPNSVHWTQPLVSRLRGLVKLVGPTISCEGVPRSAAAKNCSVEAQGTPSLIMHVVSATSAHPLAVMSGPIQHWATC